VNVKTRKRNIVIPSDPGSFADAVVHIVHDATEDGDKAGGSVDAYLEAGAKALDAAELEYARYGDTLFEVFFTGGRLATGAALAEGGARLPKNVGGGVCGGGEEGCVRARVLIPHAWSCAQHAGQLGAGSPAC